MATVCSLEREEYGKGGATDITLKHFPSGQVRLVLYTYSDYHVPLEYTYAPRATTTKYSVTIYQQGSLILNPA